MLYKRKNLNAEEFLTYSFKYGWCLNYIWSSLEGPFQNLEPAVSVMCYIGDNIQYGAVSIEVHDIYGEQFMDNYPTAFLGWPIVLFI